MLVIPKIQEFITKFRVWTSHLSDVHQLEEKVLWLCLSSLSQLMCWNGCCPLTNALLEFQSSTRHHYERPLKNFVMNSRIFGMFYTHSIFDVLVPDLNNSHLKRAPSSNTSSSFHISYKHITDPVLTSSTEKKKIQLDRFCFT